MNNCAEKDQNVILSENNIDTNSDTLHRLRLMSFEDDQLLRNISVIASSTFGKTIEINAKSLLCRTCLRELQCYQK